MDGSDSLFFPQQEQAVGDETVGPKLHPHSKSISARDLQQQLVVIGSQDLSVFLPKEIVLMLFKFMKPGDILSASQTCRRWRILGENDQLWKHKCKQAGLTCSLNSADLKVIECRNEASTIARSPWKVNFLKTLKIEKKLRQGVPQVLTVKRISQMKDHQFSWMRFFNDKIVYTYNFNLYVFSALTGDLLHELVGHTDPVATFDMDEKFIVSCSFDRSVKVWDVDTGSCLHTMLGHTAPIFCLKMHAAIAVSGSFDCTLRMWDVREGRCLRILSGHSRDVLSVQFDGKLVVSGSKDNTIKVWDTGTGECLRTMNPDRHLDRIKFNGIDVVAGYHDSIKVWDVNTGVKRHTLEGTYPHPMALQGDTLVSRGAGRTAKIWRISTGALLHTLAVPQQRFDLYDDFTGLFDCFDKITDIQVNKKFVVTSSNAGPVKLWDIKTGEFIRDLLMLKSGENMERVRMKYPKIVCAVKLNRSFRRIKLLVFNFDTNDEDYEVNQR